MISMRSFFDWKRLNCPCFPCALQRNKLHAVLAVGSNDGLALLHGLPREALAETCLGCSSSTGRRHGLGQADDRRRARAPTSGLGIQQRARTRRCAGHSEHTWWAMSVTDEAQKRCRRLSNDACGPLNSSATCAKDRRNKMQSRRAACSRGWVCARGMATVAAVISAGAALAGCASDTPHQARFGSFSGQVVVSGPLRGAAVSVDQIETKDPAMGIRHHVGDTTTDDQGQFAVDPGLYNGLLLVTTSGGEFEDIVTGATIQLDANAGIKSLVPYEPLDSRDDILISPVGALIEARTRFKAAGVFHDDPEPVIAAQKDASQRLGNHFGNVREWTQEKLASLAVAATSPTEPVRAALVQAALSFLAHDIAAAAGASPQEVNVLTLTEQLAADIGQGGFDGNDGNSLVFGQGLQVGICPQITGCSAPPAGECALGVCRTLCDLYADTPRGLLSNEMTKVIRSPDLNHTGLNTADILAVARAMSDNVDEDLFGSACIEQLDRIPPSLSWSASTPADGSFVHGTTMLKVTAFDDIDPMPKVHFLGFVDADGDPTNSVAIAAIDTTTEADGTLSVTAQASDMAGNTAMITRVVQVDNTAPVVTLSTANYFVDGTTWWTATAAPTFQGTLTEANPTSVEAVIGTTHIPGTITGSTWSVTVPAGTLDLTGADVRIVVTDAAGNQGTILQHVRYDGTPPTVSFQASPVHDEASETPTFSTDEVPSHLHSGATVDLSVTGMCPSITKYSYLLGANPPPYGAEPNGRNPLQYQLLAGDDGVGIDPNATQYRVGLDDASGTTQWITGWISAGTGTTNAGVTGYTVPIYAEAVLGLDTFEGVYHVQFQSTDRLSRTTTDARCFNLHLRAPPLHLQTPGQGAPDPDPIPVDHAFRLLSLGLAPAPAPFTGVAARLLNDNATGASLIDEDVTNGTASTIYLEVAVTEPGSVVASQSFQLRNFSTRRTVSISCAGAAPPPLCDGPTSGPLYTSPTSTVTLVTSSFPVKVFELNPSTLQPVTQVPCSVCGVGDQWKFAIPPRQAGVGGPFPPRRFKAMSMIGQVSALWPTDGVQSASAPFADTSVNGVGITGLTTPTSSGCTRFSTGVPTLCVEVTDTTPYRALTSVSLSLPGTTLRSTYGTAPTPDIAPVLVGTQKATPQGFTWISTEGALP